MNYRARMSLINPGRQKTRMIYAEWNFNTTQHRRLEFQPPSELTALVFLKDL